MDPQANLATQTKEPIRLSENKAIIIGIIGIFLPVGTQDFAVRRFFWGSMHLISLLLAPVGFFLYIFDGFCAGGESCMRPPGVMSILGSCILGLATSLLVLNFIECVKLMISGTIVFSKKVSAIAMFVFTNIAVVAWFVYKLYVHYS